MTHIHINNFEWDISSGLPTEIVNLDNCNYKIRGVNSLLKYKDIDVDVVLEDGTKTVLTVLVFQYTPEQIKDVLMLEELKVKFGLLHNGYQEVIFEKKRRLAISGYVYNREKLFEYVQLYLIDSNSIKLPSHPVIESPSDAKDKAILTEIRKILAFQWLFSCTRVEDASILIRNYCPRHRLPIVLENASYDMYFPSSVGKPCFTVRVEDDYDKGISKRILDKWFTGSQEFFYEFIKNELIKDKDVNGMRFDISDTITKYNKNNISIVNTFVKKVLAINDLCT
jgi:hypothetical protein